MKYADFGKSLSKELEWRKLELSELSGCLSCDKKNITIRKSFILLLYAHWEGCVKRVAKLYLRYVAEKKILLRNLTTNFQVYYLKECISECCKSKNTLNLQNEHNFIKKFSNIENSNVQLSIRFDHTDDMDSKYINTNNNLNLEMLESILNIIGLKLYDFIRLKDKYINAFLLNSRNTIGHGSMFIDDTEFSLEIEDIRRLEKYILLFIEFLITDVRKYAKDSFYLNKNKDLCQNYVLSQESKGKNKVQMIETFFLPKITITEAKNRLASR